MAVTLVDIAMHFNGGGDRGTLTVHQFLADVKAKGKT
jgi:hypothetical protein